MEDKKTNKKTVSKAQQAKKLYRSGKTGEEIAKEMGKGVATIWRYFKLTGGISNEDLAYHYKNRYLKKS